MSSSAPRRRRLLGALAAGAALPWLPPARAQLAGTPACDADTPLPPRFHLDYLAQASRGPLSLDGENDLAYDSDGTRYTLRSATRSVLFSGEQVSRGTLQREGKAVLLQPLRYEERRGRREPRNVDIDWGANTVRFTANPDGSAVTRPRLQDRLSVLVQAGQQLRALARPAAVALPVAGARQVSTYQLDLRGPESLDLPIGRVDAIKLERPLDAEHDGLELWIAPSLCWLPVRLRFTDDRGQVVQNQLRAARFA